MWKVKTLTIKNFMCHEDSTWSPIQDVASMIVGINNTDEGQESNGSGKSGVLEGLSLAITGECLRKVSTKELVREGESYTEIHLTMINNKIGSTLQIDRKIFNNTKSAEIDLKLNNKPVEAVPRNGSEKYDVREANKWIISQIEISKEDLLNYYLVSKKQYTPFFSLSDGSKKDVVGRFSRSNAIDPIFDTLDSEIQVLEDDLSLKDTTIAVNQGKIDAYQEQIDEFDIDALNTKRDKDVELISQRITERNAAKVQNQSLLIQQNSTLSELNVQRKAVPEIIGDSDQDEKTLAQYKVELEQFEQEVSDINDKLVEYESDLRGVVQCPKCSNEFNPGNSNVDVDKRRKSKVKAETLLKEVESDIISVEADIKQVKSVIDDRDAKLTERRRALRSIDSKIAILKTNISSTEAKISGVDLLNQTDQDSIEQLKSKIVTDPTSELQQKINSLILTNSEIISSKEVSNTDIFEKKEIKGNFIKFKTHLSNKTIAVMQAYCNEYLTRIGTDLQIEMEGYKINRDGTIRENITTHITRGGINRGTISKLSGGEEARSIVSMILTQQKLINSSCNNGGLDLCFLDEIIESVDSLGILGLMQALSSLNRTIVVITHGTFNQVYDNVTVVTKDNGVATIK